GSGEAPKLAGLASALALEAADLVVLGLLVLVVEDRLEALPDPVQRDSVLWPAGAGQAGTDLRQVELEQLGEGGRFGPVLTEEPLLSAVALDQLYVLRAPSSHPQVAQRLTVDGEESAGGAVLGAHVGEGGPVRHREAREAVAAELDELADHPVLAQHLGQGEYEVGRRAA